MIEDAENDSDAYETEVLVDSESDVAFEDEETGLDKHDDVALLDEKQLPRELGFTLRSNPAAEQHDIFVLDSSMDNLYLFGSVPRIAFCGLLRPGCLGQLNGFVEFREQVFKQLLRSPCDSDAELILDWDEEGLEALHELVTQNISLRLREAKLIREHAFRTLVSQALATLRWELRRFLLDCFMILGDRHARVDISETFSDASQLSGASQLSDASQLSGASQPFFPVEKSMSTSSGRSRYYHWSIEMGSFVVEFVACLHSQETHGDGFHIQAWITLHTRRMERNSCDEYQYITTAAPLRLRFRAVPASPRPNDPKLLPCAWDTTIALSVSRKDGCLSKTEDGLWEYDLKNFQGHDVEPFQRIARVILSCLCSSPDKDFPPCSDRGSAKESEFDRTAITTWIKRIVMYRQRIERQDWRIIWFLQGVLAQYNRSVALEPRRYYGTCIGGKRGPGRIRGFPYSSISSQTLLTAMVQDEGWKEHYQVLLNAGISPLALYMAAALDSFVCVIRAHHSFTRKQAEGDTYNHHISQLEIISQFIDMGASHNDLAQVVEGLFVSRAVTCDF